MTDEHDLTSYLQSLWIPWAEGDDEGNVHWVHPVTFERMTLDERDAFMLALPAKTTVYVGHVYDWDEGGAVCVCSTLELAAAGVQKELDRLRLAADPKHQMRHVQWHIDLWQVDGEPVQVCSDGMPNDLGVRMRRLEEL